MEEVAKTLNLQKSELAILITMITSIPITLIYHKLPVRKGTEYFQMDVLKRQIYGAIIGLCYMWLIYSINEVILLMVMGLFFYILSSQTYNLFRYFALNVFVMMTLLIAHLHRYIYHGDNPEYYGFGYIMMMLVPRVMYFNTFVYETFNKQKTVKQKTILFSWEHDKEFIDNNKVSLIEFLCYYLNYLGVLMPPVFSFTEYKHYIQNTFESRRDKNYSKILIKYIPCVVFFILSNQFMNKVLDFDVYKKPVFQSYSLIYQIYYIIVHSFLQRSRYYIPFIYGNMIAILANIRCQMTDYINCVNCVNIKGVETKTSPRDRVAAWNISVAKWLRITVYETLVSLKIPKAVSQLLTNMFSAFWHGVYPSYYLCFFLVNECINIEKIVFQKGIKYFPYFIFYFFFDFCLGIFKSYEITEFIQAIKNFKYFIGLLILIRIFVSLMPSQKSKLKANQFYCINIFLIQLIIRIIKLILLEDFLIRRTIKIIQLIKMGISYFFHWLTTRYPNITHDYDMEKMPQIDHLYLDLNGVLHMCSKDESALYKDVLNGKTIETIYMEIINYVNMVVRKVRPKKSIVIAIDGVAPRAKLQNQRDRRYHVSKNTQDLNHFLLHNLKLTPGLVDFKDNSITPGTEFMNQLNTHIDFLIKEKINSDREWRNLKVYFTGGNVPGEGEHKIFDYIRQWKQGSDYNIDDTHCVYGNDSDLIVLSLSTHIRNIVILKEAHDYTRGKVIHSATHRTKKQKRFQLIFISLLRDYFELEYKQLFNGEHYNLERIIDDFILLHLFMGNDFLPQLYCMNTKAGSFDLILQKVKLFYSKKQTYFTDKYRVNWQNYHCLIDSLLPLEKQMLQTTISDFNYSIQLLEQNVIYQDLMKDKEQQEYAQEQKQNLQSKLRSNISKLTENEEQENEEQEDSEEKEINEIFSQIEMQEQMTKKFIQEFKEQYQQLVIASQKIKKQFKLFTEANQYKRNYYDTYFKNKNNSNYDISNEVFLNYTRGINFVLRYYHTGCPDWDYFYQFDLPPLLIDIYNYSNNFSDSNLQPFEKNKPFSPFEQLLCIQPKNSLNLLPKPLAEAALAQNSYISKYYEKDFIVTPLDRIKEYTWKPIIEPINKQDIIEFINRFDFSTLSEEELQRNKLDGIFLYQYDVKSKMTYSSSLKGFDIQYDAPISKQQIELNEFSVEKLNNDKYNEINQKTMMPTFKHFQNLKIQIQMKKNRREVIYLVLTNETLKLMEKYFNECLLYYQQNNIKINLIHQGLLTHKTMKFNQCYKIKPNSLEYISIIEKAIKFSQDNNFCFESKNPFNDFQQLTVVECSQLLFSHFDIDQNEYFQLKFQTEKNSYITESFVSFLFTKTYPTLQMYENDYQRFFQQNKQCQILDLKTGHLYETQKEFLGNNLNDNVKIIQQNSYITNIQIRDIQEKKFLVTKKLLRQLGFQDQEFMAFWIILDKVEIFTQKEEHNCLILGDAYDVGLNYINIINKKVFNWKIVNDLIQIKTVHQNDDISDIAVYECPFQKLSKKNYQYIFFISEKGLNEIQYYLKEFDYLVDHIKKQINNSQLQIKDKRGSSIINNRYQIENILPQSFQGDKNIELFKLYSKVIKMNTSSLRIKSNLSLIYSRKTIEDRCAFHKHEHLLPQIQHPLTCIKNEQHMNIVWPLLSQLPYFYKLGDRVVVINNFHSQISFGKLGIVIGIYKDEIEVLFDTPTIGGTSLNDRCQNFRGYLMMFFDLFNLTQWSPSIVTNYQNRPKQCWEGQFDLFGLLTLIKREQKNMLETKNYNTSL